LVSPIGSEYVGRGSSLKQKKVFEIESPPELASAAMAKNDKKTIGAANTEDNRNLIHAPYLHFIALWSEYNVILNLVQ